MTRSDSLGVAEALVIDTGPIVALCLAGAADFVGRLPFAYLAPTEVAAEITAGQALGQAAAE